MNIIEINNILLRSFIGLHTLHSFGAILQTDETVTKRNVSRLYSTICAIRDIISGL